MSMNLCLESKRGSNRGPGILKRRFKIGKAERITSFLQF